MYIKVKVFPGLKINEVIRNSEDSFVVKVKQKPVEGLANKAVIDILSQYFKIAKHKIFLLKGKDKTNKIFEIKF